MGTFPSGINPQRTHLRFDFRKQKKSDGDLYRQGWPQDGVNGATAQGHAFSRTGSIYRPF